MDLVDPARDQGDFRFPYVFEASAQPVEVTCFQYIEFGQLHCMRYSVIGQTFNNVRSDGKASNANTGIKELLLLVVRDQVLIPIGAQGQVIGSVDRVNQNTVPGVVNPVALQSGT